MPQDLTELPETAKFEIGGWGIIIREHKVVNLKGLFGCIMYITGDQNHDRDTLTRFEEYGISYEAAVEYCIKELECSTIILAEALFWNYHIHEIEKISKIPNNLAMKIIAEQFIEKIRSCDNWGELYDEMCDTSQFTKDMKKRVLGEIEQQCLRV